MGTSIRGSSRPTPAAKANAEAECPEGKEKLPGMLPGRGRPPRVLGGRSRRAKYFNGRFTRVEVRVIDTVPRSAARRPVRPPPVGLMAGAARPRHERVPLVPPCAV